MNKIVYRLCTVVLCASIFMCCTTAFAADFDPLPTPELPPVGASDDSDFFDPGAPDSVGNWLLLPSDASVVDISIQPIYTDPNTPVTSASGLKGILIQLFGSYDPQVVQVRYQNGNSSYYSYYNIAFPDAPWIASAVIFAIILWCFFRLLGGLLCRQL